MRIRFRGLTSDTHEHARSITRRWATLGGGRGICHDYRRICYALVLDALNAAFMGLLASGLTIIQGAKRAAGDTHDAIMLIRIMQIRIMQIQKIARKKNANDAANAREKCVKSVIGRTN